MNKKFFTLLVALFAMISFGASAGITIPTDIGSAGNTYLSTKSYLLETKTGYLSVSADGTGLIVITPNELSNANYANLQRALWSVTTKAGTSTARATYEFKNVFTGLPLSLSSDEAVEAPGDATAKANLLGGDIDVWLPSSNTTTPKENFFFVFSGDKDAVIAMGLTADSKVVPLIFADYDEVSGATEIANVADIESTADALEAAEIAFASATENIPAVADVKSNFDALAKLVAALENGNITAAQVKAIKDGASDLVDLIDSYTELDFQSVAAVKTALDNVREDLATAAGLVATLATDTDPAALKDAVAAVRVAALEAAVKTALTNADTALKAAAKAAKNVIKFTPKVVNGGNIFLSANDLNTLLGKTGSYQSTPPPGFYATKDSYFQFVIDPKNTIDNPLAGVLQAQAVKDAVTGTMYAGDAINLETDPFKDTEEEWVVLKVKDGDYIVVDTSFIDGTLQSLNGLINTKTAKLYGSETTTSKPSLNRLADSYMFKFLYDAYNNSVVVISKAYIAGPKNLGTETKKNLSWNKVDAVANIVSYEATDKFTDEDATNFMTLAQLGKEYAYTFGAEPLSLVIKLDGAAKYNPTRVTPGVYLLKVVGENKANKNIGKYLKMTLDGQFEYVEVDAARQNLQHIPAAQWVIESTTANTATVTNREFEDLYKSGTTYKTGTTGEFFFLTGDTLQYEAVAAANLKNEKLGYLFVDQEGSYNLDSYTFRYLHDLSMDNPVAVGENGKMFVNKEDKPTYFRLEPITTVPYGYNGDLTGVAQLERTVYQIAAFETFNFTGEKQYVTYDADEKKYFLLEKEAFDGEKPAYKKSNFLLKENYEIATEEAVDCYYVFVEANMVYPTGTNKFMAVDAKGELIGGQLDALVDGVDFSDFVEVKKVDNKWVVANATIANLEELYANSKVSVDNSSLALVNGILGDGKDNEVANSAFKVGPDDSIIYRTIGAVEGEDALEQNIRIFRINSTAKEYLYEDANSVYSEDQNTPNGERLDISKQFNFLGVEGKGDNKLAESVMTARYVRGTVMPQYLLMVGYNETGESGKLCEICGDPECEHSNLKPGETTARVLVSFADSVSYASQPKDNFKWNTHTRLGFVGVKFTPGVTGVKDSIMTVHSSAREAKFNSFPVKFKAADTKKEGSHQPVFFSMRLIDETTNDFMLESAGKIGGTTGMTWVRIHNGVPVLSEGKNFSDAIRSEAEIFNFETTDDIATSNKGIDAAQVDVVAGQGYVTIKGAAGQQVVVANILGQVIANVVLDSNEATIAAPAGVVVVSVNGAATKALVK